MSVQDEIIYQLKQENASLRGEVKLLKSENEQLRTQSLPIKREEGIYKHEFCYQWLYSLSYFQSRQSSKKKLTQ